jgi:hypothetical protein
MDTPPPPPPDGPVVISSTTTPPKKSMGSMADQLARAAAGIFHFHLQSINTD